jgi:NADH-quinone oxidoreductase subunit I
MSGYFKDLFNGIKSLAVGLQITNRELYKKPITLQYPQESLKMTHLYRGHTELLKNPETGTHSCISCGLCAKGCPSGSITVQSKKIPGVKGKVLTSYILDFTTCSLCGQCVDNCKPGALGFSNEYNLASRNREDFVFDLLQRVHPEGVPEPKVDPELLKKEQEKKAALAQKAADKKAAAEKAAAEKAAAKENDDASKSEEPKEEDKE